MIKENEVYFYNDIRKKIKYRKPLNNSEDNVALTTDKKNIYFKTRGYLLDEKRNVFFDKPLSFSEALQAWALIPKTPGEPMPFLYFKTDAGVVINLYKEANYSVYQRAIPAFSYSDRKLKEFKPELVKIEIHDSYPFEDPPKGLTRYDVYCNDSLIGFIAVDTNLGHVKVFSLLSSWGAVAFKDDKLKMKKGTFNSTKPPYYDYLESMFQGEVRNALSTLSSIPVKFSKKVRQVLKAVMARTILKDIER